jgi:hypothetical protein
MSRVLIGLLAALMFATPMAQAQYSMSGGGPGAGTGPGIGGGGYTGGGGFGYPGGLPPGIGGSYYYPGFGFSSRPLNTGPYYNTYGGYGYAAPIYAAPAAVPGLSGFFRFGNVRLNYWQAPSGYYYPWGLGTWQASQPIYIVQNGQTQAQLPPLSSMFSDMENYLDDSNKKGKLGEVDYKRLFRRLQDVRSKFDHLRAAGGGTLDPGDEENIRRDVDNLGGEISRAVKPLPQK